VLFPTARLSVAQTTVRNPGDPLGISVRIVRTMMRCRHVPAGFEHEVSVLVQRALQILAQFALIPPFELGTWVEGYWGYTISFLNSLELTWKN
jgi:hypothetical protein